MQSPVSIVLCVVVGDFTPPASNKTDFGTGSEFGDEESGYESAAHINVKREPEDESYGKWEDEMDKTFDKRIKLKC